MGQETQAIISEIITRTENDFILFFVLIVMTLLLFFLPMYSMMRKDKKMYMDVVASNTEAIAGLKAAMELSNLLSGATLSRIHDRIDSTAVAQADINTKLARVQAAMENGKK